MRRLGERNGTKNMTGVRLADMALVVPRLVPSVVQVEEFLAFLLVAAALSVIGAALRALAQDGRDDLAEADLLVGWSAVAALFVAVGSFTAIPFTAIAMASELKVSADRRSFSGAGAAAERQRFSRLSLCHRFRRLSDR